MALTPTPADRNKREYRTERLDREFSKEFYFEDGRFVEREHAQPVFSVITTAAAPRRNVQRKQRGASGRSSAASGDGNSDAEPARPLLQHYLHLHDQQSFADLLKISKKHLQNIYSATPWLLPPAIQIPGARGPRWTPQAIQQWLSERPAHACKTAPVSAKKNKVGRPRLALRSAGGAA
jgi:hypothetical protein